LYTVLLIISLVAIIMGCICLVLETDPSEYPGKPPYKNLPPVSMSTGKRGQSPFAGTARRVLRTNGDCPLFPAQGPIAVG
jgi:hypothetical protein